MRKARSKASLRRDGAAAGTGSGGASRPGEAEIARAATASGPADPAGLRILAAAAFLLLACSLTVRAILGELWTVRVNDLVSPSPLWWNNSPVVMYVAHLMAVGGIVLGVLWLALGRRAWRFSGLEIGAGVLTAAALVSVPAASDKRLAINVALTTILPLATAAVLLQILVTAVHWRRALLAVLVAMAAANCFVAWRQQTSEYEDTLRVYQETKEQYWASQGKTVDDPEVRIYENRLRAWQPNGYFYHPNVLASFLLLTLGASVAAAAAAGWHRLRLWRFPEQRGLPAVTVLAAAVLAVLALWQLVVIFWTGSAGSQAGLLAALASGVIVWLLRRRPVVSALVGLGLLVVLQFSLVALSSRAESLYPTWSASEGLKKSLVFRLAYWKGALDLFRQHPLTGVGPGQFGKEYLSVKPPYAAEEVAHPHNWLLGVAAEWGVLGVLGVAVAVLVPGWLILRSLGRGSLARDKVQGEAELGVDDDRSMGVSLSLGLVGTTLCTLVVLVGLVPAGYAVTVHMAKPLLLALLVAAIASVPALTGRLGAVIVVAGLAAFLVHSTVEMSSAVAGAVWPFWACVALALAWVLAGVPAGADVRAARRPGVLRPALILGAVAALTAGALSLRPLRAVLAMNDARESLLALPQLQKARLDGATKQRKALEAMARAADDLGRAARIDPLDPAPQASLSLVYSQMAAIAGDSSVAYLEKAAEALAAAVAVDPRDNMLRHDYAMLLGHVAAVTKRPEPAVAAVEQMREAVKLYPNRPRGRLLLAGLLKTGAETPGLPAEWLAEAVEEIDAGLRLDAQWPADDPRRLSAEEIRQVKTTRAELAGQIGAAASWPAR